MASHSGDITQDKTFSNILKLTLVIYSVCTEHTIMRAGVSLALQRPSKALWGLPHEYYSSWQMTRTWVTIKKPTKKYLS